jgi:hypothetical protein
MQVAFGLDPERGCEAIVHRDDGRVLVVPNPGGIRHVPPHDLGQFVVERELRWQTGFWGYVARGVVFPGMTHRAGGRGFHEDERSRAAIRAAKDLLAEAEALADAVAGIAREGFLHDPSRVAAAFRRSWWPPTSRAPDEIPVAEIQQACHAFREAGDAWLALADGVHLEYRFSRRPGAYAPQNPLDHARARR